MTKLCATDIDFEKEEMITLLHPPLCKLKIYSKTSSEVLHTCHFI